MKTNILIILLVGTGLIANCQTSVPGGAVSGTWTSAGSPYLVQGSIMVEDNSTLIIEAGVTVNFQGHYKFVIQGQLLALGNESGKIVFTANDTTTGWYGLRFENNSSSTDSSILEFCTLQYSRKPDPEPSGGGIYFDNFNKARISYCLIRNNSAWDYGGGIYCFYSSPVITNNTFDHNLAKGEGGGGISCYSSDSRITYNTFIKNSCTEPGEGGGAIHSSEGSPLIQNNLIIFNSSMFGSGGGIYVAGWATIINNSISNNSVTYDIGKGGGICFGSNDASTCINNTITNNSNNEQYSDGGGIFCDGNSHTSFINNTIANNFARGNGGAIYCSNASPTFKNCIIYGNTTSHDTNQVFLYDESSDPNFTFCDIQGGLAGIDLNGNFYTGTFQNNKNTDPLFTSPTAGSGIGYDGSDADWSESGNSPCINAGCIIGPYPDTDINGDPRIIDNRIDIGAFEYQWPVSTTREYPKHQAVVSPNPFQNYSVIRFDSKVSNGTLIIRDQCGKIVQVKSYILGNHLDFVRGNLTAGAYFFELLIGNTSVEKGKLMIID
jgi:predicted outer membrane repeat protein